MEERVQIKLAGRSISIPMYRDMDTTIGIAKVVSQRLKDIEKSSTRIDTQAFALEAAMSYAIDAAENDQARKDDAKDMLLEMDILSKELSKLIKEFKPDTKT